MPGKSGSPDARRARRFSRSSCLTERRPIFSSDHALRRNSPRLLGRALIEPPLRPCEAGPVNPRAYTYIINDARARGKFANTRHFGASAIVGGMITKAYDRTDGMNGSKANRKTFEERIIRDRGICG